MNKSLTSVEHTFLKHSGMDKISTLMPYITLDNFPQSGLFTALQFIEWVAKTRLV